MKVAVSVGLLAMLLRQTDVGSLGAYVIAVDPRWIAAALSLYALMIALSAWRWRVLLRAQHVDPPFGRLGSSFLVATFFNNFLPSNIGGDIIRVADTAAYTGSRTLAAGVVLIDRALGLIALVLIAAIGSATIRDGVVLPEGPYLWLALACATAAGVPALFAPHLVARAVDPLRRRCGQWASARVEWLTGMLARFSQRRRAVALAFVGAIGVQLVLVAFYAAVAAALDIPLSPAGALLVVPMSLVVQMVPVSVNGFGVREAVFAYYFRKLGLGLDAALALSLVSTAAIALFSLSGGVTFLLRRGGLSSALLPSDTPQ